MISSDISIYRKYMDGSKFYNKPLGNLKYRKGTNDFLNVLKSGLCIEFKDLYHSKKCYEIKNLYYLT